MNVGGRELTAEPQIPEAAHQLLKNLGAPNVCNSGCNLDQAPTDLGPEGTIKGFVGLCPVLAGQVLDLEHHKG